MLVIMRRECSPADADRVRSVILGLGFTPKTETIDGRPAFVVDEDENGPSPSIFEVLPGVGSVLPGNRPCPLVQRSAVPAGTRIPVGDAEIGAGGLTLIAGSGVVEDADSALELARRLRDAGVDLLRGEAFPPGGSAAEESGAGEPALELLTRASSETGLPILSEVPDEASVDLVERYADVLLVGARNMQNFALLRRVGASHRAVMLERGLSASLDDLLVAAQHLLSAGNERVVLCERGIRTFSRHSRYTLDLAIVPRLKRLTHLPVFVDPCHACGVRESVVPLARAAVAVGADGVLLEVHPDPLRAACEGRQALAPAEFVALAAELRALAPFVQRQRETVS